MKSIVVVLKPEAARAWHAAASGKGGASEPLAVSELRKLAESVGVQLTPTHPSAQHEMLLPYFTADAVADDRAEAIAEALRKSRFVDAAYVQPTGAPAQ